MDLQRVRRYYGLHGVATSLTVLCLDATQRTLMPTQWQVGLFLQSKSLSFFPENMWLSLWITRRSVKCVRPENSHPDQMIFTLYTLELKQNSFNAVQCSELFVGTSSNCVCSSSSFSSHVVLVLFASVFWRVTSSIASSWIFSISSRWMFSTEVTYCENSDRVPRASLHV